MKIAAIGDTKAKGALIMRLCLIAIVVVTLYAITLRYCNHSKSIVKCE